jgi:glycosyltransferase involved in cell wall biosynthesis
MGGTNSIALSVIVPMYNGSHFIPTFVEKILEQNSDPERYEIIVVDNGSIDDSIEVLEKFGSQIPNLKVVKYVDKQSSYAARNYGVQKAKGSTLAFTDIDCAPSAAWIAVVLSKLDAGKAFDLVSGPVELFPEGSSFSAIEWYDRCNFMVKDRAKRTGLAPTANMVCRREVFEALQGFWEVGSGGDINFCKRAKEAGYEMLYSEELLVNHPARSSASEVFLKLERVGKGHVDVLMNNVPPPIVVCKEFGKQLLAVILMPQTVRMLKTTFAEGGKWSLWTARSLGWSVVFGFFLRWCILCSIVKRLFIRNEGQLCSNTGRS